MPQTKSLCWSCTKSCPLKGEKPCCWIDHAEPVAGWDATRHLIKQNHKNKIAYLVKSCPGFKETTKPDNKLSDLADSKAALILAEQILVQFATDYVAAMKYFNEHPHAITQSEITRLERQLSNSTMAAILPIGLNVDSYIKQMRKTYILPELMYKFENFEGKHISHVTRRMDEYGLMKVVYSEYFEDK